MAVLSLTEGSRRLAGLDPVFGRLVEAHGPPRFRRRPRVDERFESLARSIVYQQLAGRAAAAIWGRARGLVEGPYRPAAVLQLSDDLLRGAGLSGSKAAAIRDLARQVDAGRVDLASLGRRDDESVIEQLIQVRGVGRWTAQMFLMFGLRRLDVWPVGDYGVRVGFGYAHQLPGPPEPTVLDGAGEALRPYRSLAAWYCWQEVRARRDFEEG